MTLLRKLVFELPRNLSPIEDVDSFLSNARPHMTPQELVSVHVIQQHLLGILPSQVQT